MAPVAGIAKYIKHAQSRRFLLAAVATACLAGALVTSGWVSWALGVVGAGALVMFLLLLSAGISELTRKTAEVTRDVSQLKRKKESTQEPVDEAASHRLARALTTLEASTLTDDAEGTEPGGGLRVTVVIPCYNEQRFVADAIESVRRQSFTDWECIIVDDASTDASVKVIWEAVGDDPRFRVLRHRVNGGLGAARNTGLRAARGRYIAFLDSDDLLMGDSLLERVIALRQAADDPHVIGSYCGVRIELEDFSIEDLTARKGPNRGGVIDFISAGGECPFNAHAPMLITDQVRAIGGFNESMRHGAEDWDLWYRIMRNGYVFVPSKSVTAIYRQKVASMVRELPDAHVAEADRLIGSAFRSVDPEILTNPSPTPLGEPISRYLELLQKASRAVRFAAMALVKGDREAARRVLETHRDLPATLMERHLDIPDLVARGMMRALAIRSTELKQLDDRVTESVDELRRLIGETASEPESYAIHVSPTCAAVLLPQHAGQMSLMLQQLERRGLGQSDVAVVDVAREAGDQGATAEIPSEVKAYSLNEWVLQGHRAQHVVVGTVRVGAADQLARALVADGSALVEVAQRYAEVMTIDESHRPPIEPGQPVLSLSGRPSSVSFPPDGEPAATWVLEEYPDTVADSLDIADFRDVHRGERVVIIGNGPSLNECDLTKLKSEYTFAVNGIFYAADRMGFDPSYYVVEDTAVMRDNLDAIKAYEAGHKFFPSIYRKMVGSAPNVTYFMMNRGFYEPRSPDFCIPKFSFTPEQRIYSGQSVTIINLQLAYLMGFTEVVLIGMDFSYTIPDSAEVKGDVITSRGDDPNHFHPEYFGSGKVWKDPKLDRVLANYALAKEVFEADGRRIVNATVGGRLELFDRVDYDGYFK